MIGDRTVGGGYRRLYRLALPLFTCLVLGASRAGAQATHILVITGLGGDPAHSETFMPEPTLAPRATTCGKPWQRSRYAPSQAITSSFF